MEKVGKILWKIVKTIGMVFWKVIMGILWVVGWILQGGPFKS